MRATRKIKTRISGSDFTTTLTATKRADEIIAHLCLDPHIGNLTADQIDFDNIYDTIQTIETYFGTAKAVEFNYTFDNSDLSFEEILKIVCQVIFCEPYFQGGKLKLFFEKETVIPTLLFNHRNKIPLTERRDVRFGNENDYDGIELDYVDIDDTIATYYIPENRSAVKAKKIEIPGISNKIQAFFLAKRAYNKLLYQNSTVEFTATHEADILKKNEKIVVANNVRSGTQDGEIVSQNALILTLSQPYIFEAGKSYSIILQHYDGSCETIDITAGTTEYEVILAQAPIQSLSLDANHYARTTYYLVADDSQDIDEFLVAERSPGSEKYTSSLKAVNYDSRYYQNDKDFINNIIDENGNIL